MPELSFELPPHLTGLEGLIMEKGRDFIDPLKSVDEVASSDPELFIRCSKVAAVMVDHQIRGYWELARIATRPGSLAYSMKNDPNVLHEPPRFDPFANETTS